MTDQRDPAAQRHHLGQAAVKNGGADIAAGDDGLLHPFGHGQHRAGFGQPPQHAAQFGGIRTHAARLTLRAVHAAVDQRIVAAAFKPPDTPQDRRGVAARLAGQRADRLAAIDMAFVKPRVVGQVAARPSGNGCNLVCGTGGARARRGVSGRQRGAGPQGHGRSVREITRQYGHVSVLVILGHAGLGLLRTCRKRQASFTSVMSR